MIRRLSKASLLALVLIAAGLSATAYAEKPVVYTVNYPLYYFASRIAGDAAEVVFPVPKDIDPAFWMPAAEEIAAFQKADMILLNGADYAKWVPKASLSEQRMVNTSGSFSDKYIKTRGDVTHDHGPAGEHSHAGFASTTWLDPTLAIIQANAIYEALLKKIPDSEKALSKNFKALRKDLEWLDAVLEQVVAGKQGMPVIASHPVYQYFSNRYSLNFGSLQWEPGEYPDDEEWTRFSSVLEKYDYKAKWMIWEGAPLEKTVNKLASMGIGSTVFDPCANRPAEGDYLDVMKANVANLKKVYE
jgi:zinc transport system substrate-binding protein